MNALGRQMIWAATAAASFAAVGCIAFAAIVFGVVAP